MDLLCPKYKIVESVQRILQVLATEVITPRLNLVPESDKAREMRL